MGNRPGIVLRPEDEKDPPRQKRPGLRCCPRVGARTTTPDAHDCLPVLGSYVRDPVGAPTFPPLDRVGGEFFRANRNAAVRDLGRGGARNLPHGALELRAVDPAAVSRKSEIIIDGFKRSRYGCGMDLGIPYHRKSIQTVRGIFSLEASPVANSKLAGGCPEPF